MDIWTIEDVCSCYIFRKMFEILKKHTKFMSQIIWTTSFSTWIQNTISFPTCIPIINIFFLILHSELPICSLIPDSKKYFRVYVLFLIVCVLSMIAIGKEQAQKKILWNSIYNLLPCSKSLLQYQNRKCTSGSILDLRTWTWCSKLNQWSTNSIDDCLRRWTMAKFKNK